MSSTELPLWVGLTSLPSRLPLIRPALDSLLRQSRKPDRILLCLPRWSDREARSYPRCEWLSSYAPTLTVVDGIEDSGPGTKLLGCLPLLTGPTCLVLADDDLQYAPEFLGILAEHQQRHLDCSFSFYTYPCGPFTVGQGADGFSFYTPNLDGIQTFAQHAVQIASLRFADDLWISAFLHLRGIAVKSLSHLLPKDRLIYTVAHEVNQLQHLAGELSRTAVLEEGLRTLMNAAWAHELPSSVISARSR
jgi:hypothetical protein